MLLLAAALTSIFATSTSYYVKRDVVSSCLRPHVPLILEMRRNLSVGGPGTMLYVDFDLTAMQRLAWRPGVLLPYKIRFILNERLDVGDFNMLCIYSFCRMSM